MLGPLSSPPVSMSWGAAEIAFFLLPLPASVYRGPISYWEFTWHLGALISAGSSKRSCNRNNDRRNHGEETNPPSQPPGVCRRSWEQWFWGTWRELSSVEVPRPRAGAEEFSVSALTRAELLLHWNVQLPLQRGSRRAVEGLRVCPRCSWVV